MSICVLLCSTAAYAYISCSWIVSYGLLVATTPNPAPGSSKQETSRARARQTAELVAELQVAFSTFHALFLFLFLFLLLLIIFIHPYCCGRLIGLWEGILHTIG